MAGLIFLLVVLVASPCFAFTSAVNALVGSGVAAAPAGFCAGTELFCSTFESATSWDATTGTSDCDGYDTDGDYCDGDTTIYKVNTKSFGARGAYTAANVQKNFASANQGEFYFEVWWNTSTGSGTCYGPGVWTAAGFHVAVLVNSWGNLKIFTHGGDPLLDTGDAISNDTWYHIGVYFLAETGDGSANNGIIRIWMNTDGADFATANLIYENESVNTGTVAEGYGGDLVQIGGPLAGGTAYTDNFKIIAGTPSWTH